MLFKKIYLLLFFLLLSILVEGQTSDFGFLTVEVDSITNRVESSLPLNTEFFIKLPKDYKTVKKAYLLQEKGSELGDPVPLKIDKKGKNIFLKAPALFRQSNYKLVLLSNPSKKQLDTILKSSILLLEKDEPCDSDLHEPLAVPYEAVFQDERRVITNYGLPETLLEFSDLCSITREHFRIPLINNSRKQNLKYSINAYKNEKSQLERSNVEKLFLETIPSISIGANDLQTIGTAVLNDTLFLTNREKDSLLTAIINLKNIFQTPIDYYQVRLGIVPVNYVKPYETRSATKDNFKDFSLRQKNLEVSLDLIKKVLEITEEFSFINTGNDFADVKTKLYSIYNKIFVYHKQFEKFSDSINNHSNLFLITTIEASSLLVNFEKRSALLIEPSIGLAYMGAPPLERINGPNTIRPYYGITINLAPTDERVALNSPLRDPSSIGDPRRFSLLIGMTFGGGFKENRRYTDLFDDKSVLLGFNYKINHYVGLTLGSTIINQLHPNPLLEERKLLLVPTGTLNIDFQVNTILGPILNFFTTAVN